LAATQDGERCRKNLGRIAKEKSPQWFENSLLAVSGSSYCSAAIWLEFEPILRRIDG